MMNSRAMSPRRLTGTEEAEIIEATRRLGAAQAEAERLSAERDALIAEIVQAGARVSDIAGVLGVTRTTIYAAVDRARQR